MFGVPIIARTIAMLRESALFEDVIVSTDDPEIAEVSRAAGALVPFTRPAHLADDHTGTTPVITHAVQAIDALGWSFDAACAVYPTAVLLTPGDLRAGLSLLREAGTEYVLSAQAYSHPVERAFRTRADGRIEMRWPEYRDVRTQDLEPAVYDAGAFYWGTAEAWRDGRSIYTGATRALVLPADRLQDIDTPDDWARAERLFLERTEPKHWSGDDEGART